MGGDELRSMQMEVRRDSLILIEFGAGILKAVKCEICMWGKPRIVICKDKSVKSHYKLGDVSL